MAGGVDLELIVGRHVVAAVSGIGDPPDMPRQRDQLVAIIFAEKVGTNYAPLRFRQARKFTEFLCEASII